MRWGHYGVNILATVLIGFTLSRTIASLPYEFSPLPVSIAMLMRGLGVDAVRNADAIETIGMLVILTASLLVAAVLVWLANLALLRRRT
jgi:hypothetical protein